MGCLIFKKLDVGLFVGVWRMFGWNLSVFLNVGVVVFFGITLEHNDS